MAALVAPGCASCRAAMRIALRRSRLADDVPAASLVTGAKATVRRSW